MIAGIEKDRRYALQVSDLLSFAVSCSLIASTHLDRMVGQISYAPKQSTIPVIAGLALLWSMSLRLAGAYEYPAGFRQEFFALVKAGTLSSVVVLALAPVGWLSLAERQFLLLVSLALVLALISRVFVVPKLLRIADSRTDSTVLIVGNSSAAEYVARQIGFRNGYKVNRSTTNLTEGASRDDMSAAFQGDLKRFRPAEVIFVDEKKSPADLQKLARVCQEARIDWQFVPDLEHLGLSNLQTLVVAGMPVIGARGPALDGLNLCIKRLMDLFLGGLLLLLTAPIMLVVWMMIRLDSEGPAIITQPRLGRKGKIFNIYKFRTMYHNSDDAAHRAYIRRCIRGESYGEGTEVCIKLFKIVNDKRVTRVGAILRRYSLDELPQIFNVLKLEMSLVGPRPSLAYELESYQDWHKERLEAVPGLTGLWQTSGRSRLSFNDMVRLDLEYLRNWTPLQDLRLLVKTIPVIFRGTGV
jgi:exopolysaccharide biosynthesis polyprenyl glycosylphosphotransferase